MLFCDGNLHHGIFKVKVQFLLHPIKEKGAKRIVGKFCRKER